MPTLSAPAHWSKDFVEHLRTVHFTLIAVCVGLIVLSSFPSKTEIQIAHEQALEILQATNAWNDALLDDEAINIVKTKVSAHDQPDLVATTGKNLAATFNLTWKDNPLAVKPVFLHPTWLIKAEIPRELFPDTSSAGSSKLLINAPPNLRSFQRLWDGLLIRGQIIVPKTPTECLTTADDDGGDITKCELISADSVDHSKTRVFPFVFRPKSSDASEFFKRDSNWEFEFSYIAHYPIEGGQQGYHIVVLPVRHYEQIEFDGQKALVQLSPSWKAKYKRSFKDAFRELDAIDEPFDDSTIASAERILAAEARRTGDAFEAMGLKIPAELAVRCGVLLILAVQLYLWLHLHEFGNRIQRDAGFDVAWIGVYFSEPARFAFIGTLLVLPACTVVLLGIRGLRATEHEWVAWSVLVSSIAASSILSYLLVTVLPKAPSLEADTSSEQSFE